MHVAIIMDGNRRYAKKEGMNPLKGHEEGSKRAKEIIEACKSIDELSLYTFSAKNFNRPKNEVDYLMELFLKAFEKFENGDVKAKFCGKLELFPKKVQDAMRKIEEMTKENTGLKVNFCMAYDGQDELLHAVSKAIEITKEEIEKNLWVKTPVDLLIRPGGEKRLSGFLLWQSSYAELYFTDTLWPEFTVEELNKALDDYYSRNRRFGT